MTLVGKNRRFLSLSERDEKQIKNEKYLWFFTAWAMYETIIYQAFAYMATFVGFDYTTFAGIAYFGVYVGALILCLGFSFNWKNLRFNVGIFVVAAGTCLAYILTRLEYAVNILDITYSFGFSTYKLLLFYLPVLVVVSQMCDLRGFFFHIRRVNLLMTLMASYFLYRRMNASSTDEAMMIAYMIAICALVSIYCVQMNYDKKVNILFAVADFFLLLVAGSRGAWVVMMVYLVYCLLRRIIHEANGANRVVRIVVIILLFGSVAVFYMEILEFLSDTLSSFGLSSRVLNKMIKGEMSQSSGRELIQNLIYKRWHRLPFFGYGLLGDRRMTSGIGYAHNIAIEFICDFGWVVGILLLTLLALSILRLLFFRRTQEVILIGMYIVIYLMFSTSYLICGRFWIFLGLLYGENRRYIENNARLMKKRKEEPEENEVVQEH